MKSTFIPKEKFAKAFGSDIRISTKSAVLVCRTIRGKPLSRAKRLLNDLDTGKRSLGGKYYSKAVVEILSLLNSCEKNAEFAGLDAERLMVHASAHKGTNIKRRRRKAAFGSRLKATNLEIILVERGKEAKPKHHKKAKKRQEEHHLADEIKHEAQVVEREIEEVVHKAEEKIEHVLHHEKEKILFHESVVPQVLGGKTKTYRLRDHKLKAGDEVDFENVQTGEIFGKATITGVEHVAAGQIDLKDEEHGATYESTDELMSALKRHYPDHEVTPDTGVFIYTYDFKPKENVVQ